MFGNQKSGQRERPGHSLVRGLLRQSLVVVLFLCVPLTSLADPLPKAERESIIADMAHRLKPVLGDEWTILEKRWRDRLMAAKTKSAFYVLLDEMLKDTHKSHFVVVEPELASAETGPAKRDRSGRTGVHARLVDGQIVVNHVDADSPAAFVPIKPGFVITGIEGVDVAGYVRRLTRSTWTDHRRQISCMSAVANWLSGKPGSLVGVDFIDNDGKKRQVKLIRIRNSQTYEMGHFPPMHLQFEERTLANGKVGYIRFNLFMMPLLPKIQAAVRKFAKCEGIILDIRGNPGGVGMMSMPVAGAFCKTKCILGTSRSGNDVVKFAVFPAKDAYTGKLVILIDEGSASTSEILAGGLQENGRALIVGQRSMGAVLPSLIVKLPGGARVQYAIGDFKTPKGVSLEGRGVTPDYPVKMTRELLKAHGDPVLKRAVDVILGKKPKE